MAVIINGTSGITDVDGTAAAPAITGLDTDTGLYFTTNALGLSTAGTAALYINASQNVGIGTTSITNKLDVVYSSASTSGGVYSANSAASPNVDAVPIFANLTNATGTNSTSAYLFRGRSAAVDRFYVYGDGGGYFAGNVGIGTTSPANKFEVNGNNVRNTARGSTSASQVFIEAQVNDYWSTPTYIGTSLRQSGSTATGTTLGISNANLGELVFQNVSAGVIYTNGGSPIAFGTTNTERMRIDSSGNVGIGTTSPSTKLWVTGNQAQVTIQGSSAQAAQMYFYNNAATTNGLLIGQGYNSGSDNVGYISNQANADMIFRTNSTERMRIDSAGNILVAQASRGSVTTDNDLSFDMNVASNFKCTPTATGALTFTNITAGQSGYVLLVNTGGYAITAAATTKVNTTFLSTVSTAGTYLLSYFTDGTNVYVTTAGAMS